MKTSLRRPLLVAAGVLLLGSALLWFLLSLRGEEMRRSSEDAATPSDGPYRLELGLPGGQPLSEESPILFNVVLKLLPDASAGCDGSPPDDWLTGLRLELVGRRKEALAARVRPRQIQRDCAAYARLGVGPENVPPSGKYSLRAVWRFEGLEVHSRPLELQISPTTGDLTERVLARARHELTFETPELALRMLDESLPETGDRAEIHHLRGRALEALGRLVEAREAYWAAIDLVPGPEEGDELYEPPRVYLRSLRELEARMAGEDEAQ